MKNHLFKSIKSILVFICLLLVLLPTVAFLNSDEETRGSTDSYTSVNLKIENPLRGGVDSISGILNLILQNIIMPLASVGIVLAIIYSGFKFIIAEGKPEEIKKAREGLLYVLLGAAVLLAAKGISSAIEGTLKQIVSF